MFLFVSEYRSSWLLRIRQLKQNVAAFQLPFILLRWEATVYLDRWIAASDAIHRRSLSHGQVCYSYRHYKLMLEVQGEGKEGDLICSVC